MSGRFYFFTFPSLIRSRTHAAPPSALHLAHSALVMRTGRAFITSPSGFNVLRPWPRSLGGFVFMAQFYFIGVDTQMLDFVDTV